MRTSDRETSEHDSRQHFKRARAILPASTPRRAGTITRLRRGFARPFPQPLTEPVIIAGTQTYLCPSWPCRRRSGAAELARERLNEDLHDAA
eukprot:9144919-Heterocapsa_arctica.AAC.1